MRFIKVVWYSSLSLIGFIFIYASFQYLFPHFISFYESVITAMLFMLWCHFSVVLFAINEVENIIDKSIEANKCNCDRYLTIEEEYKEVPEDDEILEEIEEQTDLSKERYVPGYGNILKFASMVILLSIISFSLFFLISKPIEVQPYTPY